MRRAVSCLGLLAALLAGAAGAAPDGLFVIVAPQPAPPRPGRDELARIFKLQRRFWDDGQAIRAVNLPAAHPLRRAFSHLVLGYSPEQLDSYWRDLYFHGTLPPYVLASEEAAIRFVAATPGAIGYIGHCPADQRVLVVLRLDPGPPCPPAPG